MSAMGDYLIGILECQDCMGLGCDSCNPLGFDFDPNEWSN